MVGGPSDRKSECHEIHALAPKEYANVVHMQAGLYLRQSEDRYDDELGVDRQQTSCRRIAAEKGWTPVEYIDNDLSASKKKVVRPAYRRLLKDIESGKIQAVVCWDLDRLIRQPRELEDFMDLADEKRIELATATGDVDLSNDNGRLFARIKGAVAKAEGERKAARLIEKNNQKAASGQPGWAHIPFGFREGGVLDPDERVLIAEAYRQFIAGTSASSIAREWNAKGIKTRRGMDWNPRTLSQVLKSPRNAGMRVLRGEVVNREAWEPIVTEDVYLAAMARFSRQAIAHPAPAPGRKYLLSGIARCGVCKGWMGGRDCPQPKRNRTVRNYCCIKQCSAMALDPVDVYVTRLVVARLAQPDAADLVVDRAVENLDELRAELQTCHARLKQIAAELTDEVTPAEYMIMTAGYRKRIAAAEARMIDASKAHIFDGLSLGKPEVAEQFEALDLDRKRTVIDALMTVEIRKGKRGGPKATRLDLDRIQIEMRPTH